MLRRWLTFVPGAERVNKIDADDRTIFELLNNKKYAIDYYQREYRWTTENIQQLIEDLEGRFLADYQGHHERREVKNYGHYFLGSIVLSDREGQRFIVDGQQRLTSLTLLFIYLEHLRARQGGVTDVQTLIYSEMYGERSFNLNIEERNAAMDGLLSNGTFDAENAGESVRNIVARYEDIANVFPEILAGRALGYFVDWLLHHVVLVEIVAGTDEDAYTIFETMNDRGLSLTPTDMLKGYLLSNIRNDEKERSNTLWRRYILKLNELNRDEDPDFFKAWLRGKYAQSIRERKRGATNQDFERIGTTYHKWVRDNSDLLGLERSSDFSAFISEKYTFFAKFYHTIREAAATFNPTYPSVYYNAHRDFTLQYPVLLAPLKETDTPDVITRKVQMVADYLDIFITRRSVNFRTLGYSSLSYTMFLLMRSIRDLDLPQLSALLKQRLDEDGDDLEAIRNYQLHQRNRLYVHHLLARLTYHLECHCGVVSTFKQYTDRDISKPFEVEHLWAERYDRHEDEFATPDEFLSWRNRLGGLVLLPKGFNQSYGALPYEKKLPHYYGQNLLAKSLNPQCYENNPSFLSYLSDSKQPFRAHEQFKKTDLEERQTLYTSLAHEIWDPGKLDI